MISRPHDFDLHHRADVQQRHGPRQVVGGGDRRIPDAHDHVACLDPGLVGRIAGEGLSHDGSRNVRVDPELLDGLRIHVGDGDAKPPAGDGAGRHQLAEHVLDAVDRDGEVDPFDGNPRAGRSGDDGVESDDFPARVHERAAAIAGVDCCIGLDQVVVPPGPLRLRDVSADGADDSHGYRIGKPQRVPDRDRPVANLDRVGIAERRHSQSGRVSAQPEHGNVEHLVGADDVSLPLVSRDIRDGDRVRLIDDVRVSQD
ncbi:MAG: hypothetical protein NTY63_01135 [Candidatus Bipolaricaulota bacterium]|nr:hypothetical protein [Candidatus Bipolaricaulota bacterium]